MATIITQSQPTLPLPTGGTGKAQNFLLSSLYIGDLHPEVDTKAQFLKILF